MTEQLNFQHMHSDTGNKLTGLPQRLVQDKLISEEIALKARENAEAAKHSFITELVEKKILAPDVIARAGSEDFGVPLLDISQFDLDCIPTNLVTEKLIRKNHALPLYKKGSYLYVGISDPTNVQALSDFQFHTGIHTSPVLIEEDKLQTAIEKVMTAQESAAFDDLDDSLESLDIASEEDHHSDISEKEASEDAPVVRFVNKIILDAINRNASDIHFEPFEKHYRIRYRIDGILYEVAKPPVNLAARIVARVKIMSNLDISEHRLPQDGHFKMKLSSKHAIDFRVNTCPVVNGEKIVIRVLDGANSDLDIDSLGFDERQKQLFFDCLKQPQGMLLVTGPTGSGKTVTLYTALRQLNQIEKNVSTVEDPVEINLDGVNQVNVNLKTGMTFATALRAFLRQDPDIIMVGEVRDLETAEIGVKAAQTGHLVLSTLHTNSASETLTRLANMGIASYNIATSVSLIIAQRLARRLCNYCKADENLPSEALIKFGFSESEASQIKTFKAVGCDHCTNGYAGRVGLYEVMPVSDEIGRLIMANGNAIEIQDLAVKQGLQTLRRSGLNKVAEGITSLEEVHRVTTD